MQTAPNCQKPHKNMPTKDHNQPTKPYQYCFLAYTAKKSVINSHPHSIDNMSYSVHICTHIIGIINPP